MILELKTSDVTGDALKKQTIIDQSSEEVDIFEKQNIIIEEFDTSQSTITLKNPYSDR